MRSGFVLLCFVAALGTSVPVHAASPRLTDEVLRTSIESAVNWLVHAQEKDGHFKYEYVPYEGTYRNDDNIVRQVGALFVFGEVERFDEGLRYDLEDEMVRSIGYFEKLSVPGKYGGKSFRCIKEKGIASCKLGATALGAVALMDFMAEYPEAGKKYEPLLKDYISYILVMKKKDAGFRYYYNPKLKNQKEDESSFSNGEAFFALVRYYERTKSKDVKSVIDATFDYLNDPQKFDSALYLWAMAGVRDLDRLDPTEYREWYVYEYSKWRLKDNQLYANSSRNRCPYIEGMAYAISALDEQKVTLTGIGTEMENAIDPMLAQTSTLQVGKTNLYRYIFEDGKGELKRLKDPARAEGGFLSGSLPEDLTQRIDFTQHCISAYASMLAEVRGGAI